MVPSADRAREVIGEIVRQAGKISKVQLSRAFWLAHLYYYRAAPGFLSDWPIVRLSSGPGIDRADSLLAQLATEGRVERSWEQHGPFPELCCRPGPQAGPADLDEAAQAAIARAVQDVASRSSAELSEWSHTFSRSWQNTPNGQELDIYSDLLTDEEYAQERRDVQDLRPVLKELFG